MKQLESFILGVIAAFGAMIFELAVITGFSFFTDPFNIDTKDYFTLPLIIITIAAIEEIFKYILIIKKIEYLSFERSFITNSLFLGLGFAATELFFIKYFGFFNIENAYALIEIALLHMTTAALIGYRVATENHTRLIPCLITLSLATSLHAIYNLLVALPGERVFQLTQIYIAALVLMTFFNFIRIKSRLAA